MKVVILCGGRGTRFQEETEFRPKPMIEVGGRPIVWHIMKTYANYGFREFILCLGYKGRMIKEYFLNYEAMHSDVTVQLGSSKIESHGNHQESDWTVTLAETGEASLTGARVKRIERFIQDDAFLLTYGDGVGDIPIDRLLAFHRQHGKLGTMTAVRQPSRFGTVVAQDSQVVKFLEKSSQGQGLVNGGFFVFQREFFDYLSDEDGCVLEREPLERLARDGQLMMFEHAGYWQCMDTYRDWQVLDEAWCQGRAPWKVWS